jgi:hypothetical protein
MCTGGILGNGSYFVNASSYTDESQGAKWALFDRGNEPLDGTETCSLFGSQHYSKETGDFALSGDPQFTLDGTYYGIHTNT